MRSPYDLLAPRRPPVHAPHAVLVTQELPFRCVAGHHRINMAVLALLRAKGYRVTVLLTAPRLQGPIVINPHPDIAVRGPETVTFGNLIASFRPRSFAKLSAKRLIESAPPFVQNLVHRFRTKVVTAYDGILGKFDPPSQVEWVADWISREKPDVVFLDTVFRCPIIPHLKAPRPKLFVLTHDVFHLRHASLRARGLTLSPERFERDEESALLSTADVLIAINPDEAAVLRDMLPNMDVIEASVPVAVAPRPASEARDPHKLIFVGSDAVHNADGLRWFLAEVWPLIRKAEPRAELHVYGLACRAVSLPPNGVSLHGRVRDLAPAYYGVGVALCPLMAGSGLKIKMLEYFAHGLGCVTTSVGAAGFAPSEAPPYVVADRPEDFAGAVLAFIRNPAKTEAYEQRAYDYCALYAEDINFAALSRRLPAAPAQAAAETTRLRPSRLAR